MNLLHFAVLTDTAKCGKMAMYRRTVCQGHTHLLYEKNIKMGAKMMEQKKNATWWISWIIKIFSGLALYFSIAILITAVDKVIASGKIGIGYVFLLTGCTFLVVQFLLTIRTTKELLSAEHFHWVPALMKTLVGVSLFLSLAILAKFSEIIISPQTATLSYMLTFVGVLLFAAQFSLIAYGIGEFLDKKSLSEEE